MINQPSYKGCFPYNAMKGKKMSIDQILDKICECKQTIAGLEKWEFDKYFVKDVYHKTCQDLRYYKGLIKKA